MNSAWTPAARPTEAGRLPSHARFAWGPLPADDHTAEDTSPIALVPRQREPDEAVVHEVPETPPRGLRKFDLGIVPASVTPPRSWRRAAWFAVGTSAAVVCGLAVAAVRFVGPTTASDTIDALPAFPTQKLGTLPIDESTAASRTSATRTSSSSRSSRSRPGTADRPGDGRPSDAPAPGSSDGATPSGPPTGTWTEPAPPPRTTIGPAPVTPTDPDAMGDRTERYFALVTEDPQAAHEMCTGDMAREGPEGIEARYAGVDHVEVQQITIDRNTAETTSTVKVVHEDGTETFEQRQLTFTWGGDPKISDEAPAG